MYYDVLTGKDTLFDTEIVDVRMPTGRSRTFRLTFDFWEDVWKPTGKRRRACIKVEDPQFLQSVEPSRLIGYEVRDIAIEESRKVLRVDTTDRRVDIRFSRYSVEEVE